MTGSGPPRLVLRLALGLIILVGFGLRLLSIPGVIGEDRIYPLGNDAYYHMRRIVRAVREYPRVESYDRFLNYPEGARCFWRPGFDFLIASAAMLFGGRSGDQRTIELVACWVIPAIGTAGILVVWLLARRLYGEVAALFSAAAAALLPTLIFTSRFGNVDHHVLEAAAYPVGFLLLLWAMDGGGTWRALVWGAFSGGTLLLWNGAELFPILAAVYGLIAAVLWRREAVRAVRQIAVGLVVVVGMTGVFVLLFWDRGLPAFSYAHLSPLHVVAESGALAVAASALAVLQGARRRWCVLGLWVAAGVAVAAWAPLREGLQDALLYIAKRKDPIVSLADESRRLTAGGVDNVVGHLTWVWLLLPVGIALAARGIARGERRFERAFLLWWLLPTGAMALMQQRFAPLFGVPLALLVGEGWPRWKPFPILCLVAIMVPGTLVLEWVHPSHESQRLSAERGADWRFSPDVLPGGTVDMLYLRTTLHWMRRNLPPAGKEPSYGIMAPWQAGHWIIYLVERPAVVTPFGQSPQAIRGAERARRFFLAETEEEAVKILDECRARYVMIMPMQYLGALLEQEGRPTERYYTWQGTVPRPTPRFARLMAVRLAWGDPTLRKLREIYRSPEEIVFPSRSTPFARVYEKVEP